MKRVRDSSAERKLSFSSSIHICDFNMLNRNTTSR